MKMRTALTVKEVTPVYVILVMRVMASTAQVCECSPVLSVLYAYIMMDAVNRCL